MNTDNIIQKSVDDIYKFESAEKLDIMTVGNLHLIHNNFTL